MTISERLKLGKKFAMVYRQEGTEKRASKDPTVNALTSSLNNHLRHNYLSGNGSDKWIMRETDGIRRLARTNQVQLGPDSLPSQGLQINDVFFDIRLTGAGVHTLDRTTLHLTVQNTLGDPPVGETSDLVPMLPQYFFNRIEVQSDGSFTDDTIYPYQLLWDYLHTIGYAEKSSRAYAVGMTYGTAQEILGTADAVAYDENEIAIVQGGTQEYFIPIHTFLTTAGTFLPGKTQDPRFRMYLAQNPVCTYNDAAAIAGNGLLLAGAEMILTGVIYSNEILLSVSNHYNSKLCISRVVLHERQLISVKGVTSFAELGDLALTSFNGEYAGMTIYLGRNDATKQQLYMSGRHSEDVVPSIIGWLPLSRIGVIDSSGNPVGYNKEHADYIRADLDALTWPETSYYGEKYAYFLPWATDARTTLSTGQSTGGMVMDSNFTLQLVTGQLPAGLPESFTVNCTAMRYGLFQRSGAGTFKITKL